MTPSIRKIPSLLACLGLLAAASGCAPGSDLPPLPTYQTTAYRLGGGDEVRIITFNEEQMTGQFKINDQGNVALPLLGTVHAAGLTTTGLGARIARQLNDKQLLRRPSVSVEVESYRPVFVLGEVSKPGQYAYQPGMTVLTAVAIAGGFTYRAVEDRASVLRTTGESGKAEEGLAQPRDYVAPGDVIKIYERRF